MDSLAVTQTCKIKILWRNCMFVIRASRQLLTAVSPLASSFSLRDFVFIRLVSASPSLPLAVVAPAGEVSVSWWIRAAAAETQARLRLQRPCLRTDGRPAVIDGGPAATGRGCLLSRVLRTAAPGGALTAETWGKADTSTGVGLPPFEAGYPTSESKQSRLPWWSRG